MGKYTLTDWLKSINETKINLMDTPDFEKGSYPSFIINTCLANFPDTFHMASFLNSHHDMSERMAYEFLLNTVSIKKRFHKFEKKIKIDSTINNIKRYYKCSFTRAYEYYKMLDVKQLTFIDKLYYNGGIEEYKEKSYK